MLFIQFNGSFYFHFLNCMLLIFIQCFLFFISSCSFRVHVYFRIECRFSKVACSCSCIFVFNFSNCMFMFMFLVFNFRIVCRFSCFWSSIFELYVDFHVFCLPLFMLLFHVIVSSFFILFYGLYLSNNYGCSCLQLLLFIAVTIHVFRVFSNYFFNLFFIVLLSVYSIWEVALVDLVAPEARIIPAVMVIALVVVVIL